MTVYLVGGYPASGKSVVAALIQKHTGLPVVSFDERNYKEEYDKFILHANGCILDMTFETKKTVSKYLRKIKGDAVMILVKCDISLALKRNQERERIVPHPVMLSYWLTPVHPFESELFTAHKIYNTGTMLDLEDQVVSILKMKDNEVLWRG